MPYNPQTMNVNNAQASASASVHSFGISGPQVIDAPQGTKYFALKKEMAGTDVYLNIIPWGIETKKHMGVHNGTAQIGQGEFMAEMWTHRVEGITKGTTLCLQSMYGERCPYCEAAKAAGNGDAKASHRMALWVQHVDMYGNPIGGDPTPKLFITSYATFGKALLEAADVQGRRQGLPGPIPFASPDLNGRIVAFRVGTKSMGNNITFCEATNFEFIPRKNPISQDILNNIPAIDKFLHIPTDAEINAALYGNEGGVDAGTPAYPENAQPQQPAYPQQQPAYPEPSYPQPQPLARYRR